MEQDKNRDDHVISHFGGEWKAFNYLDSDQLEEVRGQFAAYVRPLPPQLLTEKNLVIADFGAGSGRWAHFLLEHASQLWLIEPGKESFSILQQRFDKNEKVHLLNETVSENEVPNDSLDLAVSLGVLHHLPDTGLGMRDIFKKSNQAGISSATCIMRSRTNLLCTARFGTSPINSGLGSQNYRIGYEELSARSLRCWCTGPWLDCRGLSRRSD